MQSSVVIPARNSSKTIGGTIEALLKAEHQPDEILVVDGCSVDNTIALAKQYGASIVSNDKRHVSAARQLGTLAARYEIIAFTDSDCRPEADWLKRIVSHFEEDAELCGVGGKVALVQPRNDVQAYSAHVFESIMHFPEECVYVTQKGMRGSFAGANCAYRKDAILAVGGFNEFFTNHAEEIDLFWRLIDRKVKLLFDPAIMVEHLEYADTISSLVRTNFNYGIASSKLAKYHIGTQIDLKLYYLLLNSLLTIANPFNHDPWALLRTIQLSTFLSGKIYSSLRFWTINL